MGIDRIAILGWGSLLWEHAEFDAWHEPWQFDGPKLKIEFSRISKKREGALTLVVDSKNGCPATVAYCMSRRNKIELTVEDLRVREGAHKKGIGYFSKGGASQFRDGPTHDAIVAWAAPKALEGVVWTDLESNFAKETGKIFSVEAALDYLARLKGEAKAKAEEYLRNAPDFVQTPLRKAWNGQIVIDSAY
jgi:hypothetical protein